MQKALIIEDEKSIAELERDYLEVSGFSCDLAFTGVEGLKKAFQENYDVIILDLMLPGTDGFELCRKIREHLEIPILMVTAKNEDIDKLRGFDRGADDYIVKPFNANELVARVKAHVKRYKRLAGKNRLQDFLRHKGLEIDTQSRQVFVDGEEKVFTGKEFDLLVFLVTHPNIVFTKDQLFDRLWGLEAVGDISTITVHIRKIREKIEPNPSEPIYIETVWGVGYKMKR